MKLQKTPPEWHDEAIGLLKQNFAQIHAQFLDSTKKAVWLGIFLNEIKERGKQDGSIPHGQFGDFLKTNLPDVSWRQATTYMQIGRNVLEKGKFQIGDYRQFATGELPPKILHLIEGKNQKELQLCLDLKQVDDEGNPQRGQQKGSKGCTKAMRLNAQMADDKERLTAAVANVPMVCLWLKKNCNLAGFPRFDEVSGGATALKQIREAITDAHLFFKSLDREGGAN